MSKYGGLEESRDLTRGGRGSVKASIWWKDLCRLYWGGSESGMRDSFLKNLGSGEDTLFWSDYWVGDRCLRDTFPRLYRLSLQKDARVSEMGSWVDGVWNGDFRWGRILSNRNKDLFDGLVNLIGRSSPTHSGSDFWSWRHSSNSVYRVSMFYNILLRQKGDSTPLPKMETQAFRRLWKGWAIRKANSTAWKILKGRMATVDNLSKRGVLIGNNSPCCLCGEDDETVSHLFCTCKVTSSI